MKKEIPVKDSTPFRGKVLPSFSLRSMKKYLFVLFLLLNALAFSQDKLLLHGMDTIDFDYRSVGHPLETIDMDLLGVVNLRPAGGFAQLYEHNLSTNLYTSPAGFTYLQNEKRVTERRAGLPYIGFRYGFGSALNQAADVNYHQFFSEDSHLHFRYHRRTSNGLIRRGAFRLNDVHLIVHHKKDAWSTKLDAYYGGHFYEENDGLIGFGEIGSQPLDFIPVQKENAETDVRKIDIKWMNYYRLYSDSLIAHGGVARTHYTLTGREYRERNIDISGSIPIFIDSIATRDQFQTPSIAQGGGYFFSSDFLQVDGTLNFRYWRYQNLGQYRDTAEIFLHSNAFIGWDRFNIRNEFYLNTLGALGELYNRASLFFEPIPKTYIKGGVNFDNRLPVPYQRFHFANHIQWELENLETQQIINLNGRIQYGDTNMIYAGLDLTSVNNGLYFIADQWRQDTLDFVSVGTLNIGGEFHSRLWHLYPQVMLRFNTDNYAYQPAFSARLRAAFKKGYFKDDALILAFGVDLGYDTDHDHLLYNTLLNVMEPGTNPLATPSLFRINFFMGAQIDTFRFFLRAENIDYFINPQDAPIDLRFPTTPFLVRLGITWDFFN